MGVFVCIYVFDTWLCQGWLQTPEQEEEKGNYNSKANILFRYGRLETCHVGELM